MPARTVHVPCAAEQDEDGVWCARAELHPGVVAYGDGDTRQAAIDDLREALIALIETVGVPDQVDVPVAA